MINILAEVKWRGQRFEGDARAQLPSTRKIGSMIGERLDVGSGEWALILNWVVGLSLYGRRLAGAESRGAGSLRFLRLAVPELYWPLAQPGLDCRGLLV